jgi:hypothetical protein
VFGVQRDLPLNYVEREHVDTAFREALQHQRHIVIYGSSKQGKSSLRRWALRDRTQVLISCINMRDVEQLHLAILKGAGFTIDETTTTEGRERKIKVTFGADWPGGVKPGFEAEKALTTEGQVTSRALSLDPSDFNEVIAALDSIGLDGLIILEDYHYLDDSTQGDFARLLKAYYDYSQLCFIVIGVWIDEHRLLRYAGDLRERVTPVSADMWTRDQLAEVIEKGEVLLNIEFSADFKEHLLDNCFDSVWVVQQVCNRACLREGVKQEQDEHRKIGSLTLATDLLNDVVASQTARSQAFIDGFSSGPVASQDGTPARVYQWITFALLAADPFHLERGLYLEDIKRFTDEYYNLGYMDGTLIRLNLEQTTWFQMHILKISPMVVDYDRTARRLNVVDREFLIWLRAQNREVLLRDAGMPPDALVAWRSRISRESRHDAP